MIHVRFYVLLSGSRYPLPQPGWWGGGAPEASLVIYDNNNEPTPPLPQEVLRSRAERLP